MTNGSTPFETVPPAPPAPPQADFAAAQAAWQRVSVVTVTHHSAGVISACLASVAQAARVFVVDNASDDGTPDLVRRLLPAATVIGNTIGRGFGNGCNQGLEQVETEFALLLGPDSTIDGASLAGLVEAADRWPDAGMVAPEIIAPDGHTEPSHNTCLLDRITVDKGVERHPLPEGPICADHLSGAVLLVRMTALRQVGFFDRNIFLYYEDDDLSIRMRRGGHALILVPGTRATHIGGGSSRPSVHHRWEKFWNMAWSRLYIEDKYAGRQAARRTALRLLPKLALKTLGYGLTLNKWKAIRDAARLCGTLGWLAGARAMPVIERES